MSSAPRVPVTAGTVGEALAAATDALAASGAGEARLDAELMLCEATGLGRAALVARPEAAVDAAAARRFGTMLRRRLAREPLAYVLGRRGFRRIELTVDQRVLVPRPETEMLVELALELAPRTVLDVGTGSGAVALAVADELEGVEVVATDVSPGALAVARANAERLRLADRVRFELGSVPAEPRRFDLLLANLPYVTEAEMATLAPEVARWEPRGALVAGADGLDAIRGLTGALARGAASAAAVGLEVGTGQGAAVAALLAGAGYPGAEVRRDLAGHERLVVGRRSGGA